MNCPWSSATNPDNCCQPSTIEDNRRDFRAIAIALGYSRAELLGRVVQGAPRLPHRLQHDLLRRLELRRGVAQGAAVLPHCRHNHLADRTAGGTGHATAFARDSGERANCPNTEKVFLTQ